MQILIYKISPWIWKFVLVTCIWAAVKNCCHRWGKKKKRKKLNNFASLSCCQIDENSFRYLQLWLYWCTKSVKMEKCLTLMETTLSKGFVEGSVNFLSLVSSHINFLQLCSSLAIKWCIQVSLNFASFSLDILVLLRKTEGHAFHLS